MTTATTCPRETSRSRARRSRLDEIEHRIDRLAVLVDLLLAVYDQPGRVYRIVDE